VTQKPNEFTVQDLQSSDVPPPANANSSIIQADKEYLDMVNKSHSSPREKYAAPITTSQEMGWETKQLVIHLMLYSIVVKLIFQFNLSWQRISMLDFIIQGLQVKSLNCMQPCYLSLRLHKENKSVGRDLLVFYLASLDVLALKKGNQRRLNSPQISWPSALLLSNTLEFSCALLSKYGMTSFNGPYGTYL
jgi:hypothetical protein